MENKFLENLTEQDVICVLNKRAMATFDCQEIENIAEYTFCFGNMDTLQIHMTSEAFDRFAEVLNKEPVVDTEWGKGSQVTKNTVYVSFEMFLLGRKFEIFCLKDKALFEEPAEDTTESNEETEGE